MRWQELSIHAHGHRILLVKPQIAPNICAPKSHIQHLLYAFWRPAWKYKHKRLLCLVELKGQPKSKWLPHKWSFSPCLSIPSCLWPQSWCFTQREGGVTQPRKGSVSCCAVLISGLIHLTSSYVLDRITWEWFLTKLWGCFTTPELLLAVCQTGIKVCAITRLDFSVSSWYIWAKQCLSGSAPGWKGAGEGCRQALGSQLFIYFFRSNMLKNPLPSEK